MTSEKAKFRNNYDDTWLIKATTFDDSETVKQLIRAGADPNAKCDYGFTALHMASIFGYTETVRALTQEQPDENIREKEKYLQNMPKFFFNEGLCLNTASKKGSTALHFASNNGHTDIVRLLLMAGSDVNITNKKDVNPLILAAINGYTDIARELINSGSFLNHIDNDGLTRL